MTDNPAEPSPEVAPMQDDPKCHLCEGTGAVDSGGNEPWGAQIWIKCGYCAGTGFENPLGPDDLAELDRLMETYPRLWLHIRTVGQALILVQDELSALKGDKS
jgi:hypothetical protein